MAWRARGELPGTSSVLTPIACSTDGRLFKADNTSSGDFDRFACIKADSVTAREWQAAMPAPVLLGCEGGPSNRPRPCNCC